MFPSVPARRGALAFSEMSKRPKHHEHSPKFLQTNVDIFQNTNTLSNEKLHDVAMVCCTYTCSVVVKQQKVS
jgi:hypothetical protein